MNGADSGGLPFLSFLSLNVRRLVRELASVRMRQNIKVTSKTEWRTLSGHDYYIGCDAGEVWSDLGLVG